MKKCMAWMILLALLVPLMADPAMAEMDEIVCAPVETSIKEPEPTAAEPSPTPTPEPTPAEPSPTPTPEPTAAEPSPTPTPEPTAAEPSPTPTPESTAAEPSPTPTPEPTAAEPSPTLAPDAVEVSPEPVQSEIEIGTADVDTTLDSEATPAPEAVPETMEEIRQGLELVQRRRNVSWRGVEISGEQGMTIPKLYQRDYRETVCFYDGRPRSVSTSGCGAACLSMVIAYLTGDRTQNPYTLFCEAVDCGWYSGNGLGKSTLNRLAQRHSLKTQWIPNNAKRIIAELEAGHPIIAHMGEGNFTDTGHYIVLRGVTENGKILVNDPNSRSNSGKAFPISLLLQQARTDNAFMVCRADK